MVINDPVRLLGVLKEAETDWPCWWRGQADSTWELLPHTYRGNRSPMSEMGAVHYFRSKAPARYANCPTNNIDWLFLMQHHGLPTRLLDWSASPLVALFFAVCQSGYDSTSGALWVLNGVELNRSQLQTGTPGIITAPGDHHEAMRIAKGAFAGTQDDKIAQILAIHPPHIDIRMLVQQSLSTIHSTKIPLEKLEKNQLFLRKIEIPSDQKEPLRSMLQLLGINESSLFPDLDHLAKDLAADWINR